MLGGLQPIPSYPMTDPDSPIIGLLTKREFLAMLLYATSAPTFQNCDMEKKAKNAWVDADIFLSTAEEALDQINALASPKP